MLYRSVKRLLDLIGATVAILVFSPVLLIVSVILKLTGEHEVFFVQTRLGENRRPFPAYKFTTMRKGSEKQGSITAKNDSRVLPVGKVLRKTKLNELPQLFNVFLGHISFVGPRPLTEDSFSMYPDELQPYIYDRNKPGITGIGSVFFRSEDEITAASEKPLQQAYIEDVMPIKAKLELWYRDNKNLWVDFKLFFLTIWVVLVPGSTLHLKAFKALPDDIRKDYMALVS